ncbi:hypothetical protein TRVA0_055S00540 [Trichomonascus vanleenenianus]|uniref:uncharacterized protein n=1 Tax=Trichomonascus vanleenenianus TaxID=2268995 RepID=UPI003ECB01A3
MLCSLPLEVLHIIVEYAESDFRLARRASRLIKWRTDPFVWSIVSFTSADGLVVKNRIGEYCFASADCLARVQQYFRILSLDLTERFDYDTAHIKRALSLIWTQSCPLNRICLKLSHNLLIKHDIYDIILSIPASNARIEVELESCIYLPIPGISEDKLQSLSFLLKQIGRIEKLDKFDAAIKTTSNPLCIIHPNAWSGVGEKLSSLSVTVSSIPSLQRVQWTLDVCPNLEKLHLLLNRPDDNGFIDMRRVDFAVPNSVTELEVENYLFNISITAPKATDITCKGMLHKTEFNAPHAECMRISGLIDDQINNWGTPEIESLEISSTSFESLLLISPLLQKLRSKLVIGNCYSDGSGHSAVESLLRALSTCTNVKVLLLNLPQLQHLQYQALFINRIAAELPNLQDFRLIIQEFLYTKSSYPGSYKVDLPHVRRVNVRRLYQLRSKGAIASSACFLPITNIHQ